MTEPMNATEVDATVEGWHRLEARATHIARLVAEIRWGRAIRHIPTFSLYDVDLDSQSVEAEYYDHGDTMTLAYPLAYLSQPDDEVVEAEQQAESQRETERRTKLEREAKEAEQRRRDQEKSTWLRLNARAKREGWV